MHLKTINSGYETLTNGIDKVHLLTESRQAIPTLSDEGAIRACCYLRLWLHAALQIPSLWHLFQLPHNFLQKRRRDQVPGQLFQPRKALLQQGIQARRKLLRHNSPQLFTHNRRRNVGVGHLFKKVKKGICFSQPPGGTLYQYAGSSFAQKGRHSIINSVYGLQVSLRYLFTIHGRGMVSARKHCHEPLPSQLSDLSSYIIA